MKPTLVAIQSKTRQDLVTAMAIETAEALTFNSHDAQPRIQTGIPDAYTDLAQRVFADWAKSSAVTLGLDVAEAVWRAANDSSCPVRLAADAVALAELA